MATGDKLVNLDSLKTAYDTAAKITAPMEASSTASAAHAAGEHFIYNGLLYIATSDIAPGATITPGTNCRAVPGGIGGEVSDLKSALLRSTTILDWEQGGYDPIHSANPVSVNTRIRTSRFVCTKNGEFTVYALSGYEFVVLIFSADESTYYGTVQQNDTTGPYLNVKWMTSFDFTVKYSGTLNYYLVVRNANDPTAEILPSAGNNIIFTRNSDGILNKIGMPAESKSVGDKFSAIDAKFANDITKVMYENYDTMDSFVQGKRNVRTLVINSTDLTRCTTAHATLLHAKDVVCVRNIAEGHKVAILGVNNGNVIYTSGWLTTDFAMEVTQEGYYYGAESNSDESTNISPASITTKYFYINEKYILSNSIRHNKEVRILFVGNSLTQDGISYLPYMLKTYYPEISFKLYMWYIGGYDLGQQYAKFTSDGNATIFSVAENTSQWTNYNDSKTMAEVTSEYEFDVVCLQEYFYHKSSYTDADLVDWNNCRNYITAHYKGGNPLEFVSLFHAPARDDANNQFNLIKNGNNLIMRKTIADDMIPNGIAVYRALSTELDEIGDAGHLSPDGIHTQEGLPCLLQTYVTLCWLFDRMGINRNVYGCPMRMTTAIYNTLSVPGPNLGSGVITGTDDENLLAQEVAIKAYKEGKYYVMNNIFTES